MRGKFITFLGPEGSGKTTQARRLIAGLERDGIPVLYTREPGGTRTGEAIREILQYDKAGEPIAAETEVLLFAASRAQLVRKVILPALEQGVCVISDRFADSTTAYQGFGRGFAVDQMLAINEFAIDGARPDCTLLLDIDVEAGLRRLATRHQSNATRYDRIEREEIAFHRRVRDGYLELSRRWPERFRVIPADGSEDQVAERVWSHVSHVLNPTA
jgi:dTMP kinase